MVVVHGDCRYVEKEFVVGAHTIKVLCLQCSSSECAFDLLVFASLESEQLFVKTVTH